MNLALRVYRLLARAFPHEFKLLYGTEVLQLGEDIVEQVARRNGALGLLRLVADIAIRVPIEYLSEMRGDMKYAVRALRKSPGFALVGIVSMGLGIGLTTNLYSSKWTLLSRELPAAANARRVVMCEKPVSYYYVERYRDNKVLFAHVAAFQTGVPFNVTFRGDASARPQRVFGQIVSPDYFAVLGVRPQRGRVLSAEYDKTGNAPVVVVSDRFWRNRLNSSPAALGQTIQINGQSATIVGITPEDFNGALSMTPAELFVPTTAPPAIAPELANDVLRDRNAREFLALMCLAPGVTIESAEAALDGITREIDDEDTTTPLRVDKGRRVTLLPAGTMVPVPRNVRAALTGFFGVLMGLIMTIACMNLANMLLARGTNRRKEFAIRLAVGASRFRLVRQMTSEGILLSLMGGISGFALAYLLSVLKVRFVEPTAVPHETSFIPDWHAAIFVFGLAIVSGIAFSLTPALRATKGDTTVSLKQAPTFRFLGYRRFGLRNILMVAQLTGSLMLLLITGFLILGISRTTGVQTKFDPHTMYLLSIDPIRDGYSREKAERLFEGLPERMRDAGAARGVALAAQAPFPVRDEDEAVQLTAEDARGTSRTQVAAFEETVGAGYFAVLGEPVLGGREFVEADQRETEGPSKILPVVLNESAARGFFGNGAAIGRRVIHDRQSYEVIGVVHDLQNGIGRRQATVYLPLTQRNFARPPADGITILVRSDAGADALGQIRGEIAAIDPKLNVFNVRTLSDYFGMVRSSERFAMTTYGAIGVFGLVLAAIGLAGVTAYGVAQRRKEIGIRMALGAPKLKVLLLVLAESGVMVTVGTIAGFLGAFGVARALSALTSVFVEALDVGTNDSRLLVGAPLLLAALTLLACYMPARAATRIDPLTALREE